MLGPLAWASNRLVAGSQVTAVPAGPGGTRYRYPERVSVVSSGVDPGGGGVCRGLSTRTRIVLSSFLDSLPPVR